MILVAKNWKDYELIDAGVGEKLERWGKYYFIRPDPQVIWPRAKKSDIWAKSHAKYIRSPKGGGAWEKNRKFDASWNISYKDLTFQIKPTDFKHMGLFPEQAVNWEWIIKKIRSSKTPVKVLNLFAYTGGATVAASYAGAEVCHVDSAKGMVNWAKENIKLTGLSKRPLRFIVDDVIKFVKREHRRGKKYDAIIMDPPSYGRGTSGETWKIEKHLLSLISDCMQILSPDPLFFLLNSYTAGFSHVVLENLLRLTIGKHLLGNIESGEVGLQISDSKLVLPCGVFGRWEKAEDR